jgi:hypothetical protein
MIGVINAKISLLNYIASQKRTMYCSLTKNSCVFSQKKYFLLRTTKTIKSQERELSSLTKKIEEARSALLHICNLTENWIQNHID